MGEFIWWAAAIVATAIGLSLILTTFTGIREEIHHKQVNNRLDHLRDTNYLMEIKGNTVTIHWPNGDSETLTKRDSESHVLFGQRISDLIDGRLTGDF